MYTYVIATACGSKLSSLVLRVSRTISGAGIALEAGRAGGAGGAEDWSGLRRSAVLLSTPHPSTPRHQILLAKSHIKVILSHIKAIHEKICFFSLTDERKNAQIESLIFFFLYEKGFNQHKLD